MSIGVPVYNGERFLARALDSVLAQDLEDWELLISDNGSEDDTVAIAREYSERDPRIRWRANERNLGAVANFEVVFRETSGKYFMWLAHDDWIDPQYLERCVRALESEPDLVMAFAGMTVVGNEEETLKTSTLPMEKAASGSPVARFHSVLWGLEDPTSPVFGVARRSTLEHTGLIRNSNEPDRILIGELSLLGGIHQDPDLLFFHFQPPGHTDRDNWAWLDPRNIGRPRLATFRIVGHQWNAIWGSRYRLPEKLVMTGDLLVASAITRTRGKAQAIRGQMAKRK